MLPKQNRLPSCLIPEVLKKGRRFFSPLFTLITSHQPSVTSHQSPLFAFIVSLKISKHATTRNKIKRQLKNIVRLMHPRIKSGFNIIVLAQKVILKTNFQKIEKELKLLFQKAKLIKENEKFFMAKNIRK